MFRTFITLKACKQRKTTSKQNKRDVNFIDLEEESKNNSIQEGRLLMINVLIRRYLNSLLFKTFVKRY